jgi:hypothetical protein
MYKKKLPILADFKKELIMPRKHQQAEVKRRLFVQEVDLFVN